MNQKFLAQNPKVVLIVNNFPAYLRVPGLAATNLMFLPPNTTSITPPSKLRNFNN